MHEIIPIKTTSDCTISRKAVEEIVNKTGDAIANLLERVALDTLGGADFSTEFVVLSVELGLSLRELADFRTEHLDYTPRKEEPNV